MKNLIVGVLGLVFALSPLSSIPAAASELSDARDRLYVVESQIADLQAEISNIRSDIQNTQSALDSATKKKDIRSLERDLDKLDKILQEKLIQLSDLSYEAESLRAEIEDLEANTSLEDELQAVRDSIAQTEASILNLQNQIDELNAANAGVNTRSKQGRAYLSDLATLEAQMDSLTAELENLQNAESDILLAIKERDILARENFANQIVATYPAFEEEVSNIMTDVDRTLVIIENREEQIEYYERVLSNDSLSDSQRAYYQNLLERNQADLLEYTNNLANLDSDLETFSQGIIPGWPVFDYSHSNDYRTYSYTIQYPPNVTVENLNDYDWVGVKGETADSGYNDTADDGPRFSGGDLYGCDLSYGQARDGISNVVEDIITSVGRRITYVQSDEFYKIAYSKYLGVEPDGIFNFVLNYMYGQVKSSCQETAEDMLTTMHLYEYVE